MDLLINNLGSLMGLMEADIEGNSRKPEKKRTMNAKPNMSVEMVMELRDFNNIVWSLSNSMVFFSPFQERKNGSMNLIA